LDVASLPKVTGDDGNASTPAGSAMDDDTLVAARQELKGRDGFLEQKHLVRPVIQMNHAKAFDTTVLGRGTFKSAVEAEHRVHFVLGKHFAAVGRDEV